MKMQILFAIVISYKENQTYMMQQDFVPTLNEYNLNIFIAS